MIRISTGSEQCNEVRCLDWKHGNSQASTVKHNTTTVFSRIQAPIISASHSMSSGHSTWTINIRNPNSFPCCFYVYAEAGDSSGNFVEKDVGVAPTSLSSISVSSIQPNVSSWNSTPVVGLWSGIANHSLSNHICSVESITPKSEIYVYGDYTLSASIPTLTIPVTALSSKKPSLTTPLIIKVKRISSYLLISANSTYTFTLEHEDWDLSYYLDVQAILFTCDDTHCSSSTWSNYGG